MNATSEGSTGSLPKARLHLFFTNAEVPNALDPITLSTSEQCGIGPQRSS
jgi:hypothetical protein